MVIREMSEKECRSTLSGVHLVRLACSHQGQPYVIPIYLAYFEPLSGDACLYGYSTLGQKIEWMRSNPLVCVEMDDVKNTTRWKSVVVFGRFQELSGAAEPNAGRLPERHEGGDQPLLQMDIPNAEAHLAHQLLQSRAMWWEPAASSRLAIPVHDSSRQFEPIYFKILVEQLTGREAI